MAVSLRHNDVAYINVRPFTDELVNEHWQFMRNRAFWHIFRGRVRDRNAVLSDAHWALFRAARTYKPDYGVPFELYLRKRIDYEIVDGYRNRCGRDGQRINLAVESLTEAELREAARYRGGEDRYAESEDLLLVLRIRDLFAELTDSERDVMWKLYVQGKSPKEVAAMRGVSSSAVSVVHRRAVTKLRRSLEVTNAYRGRRRRWTPPPTRG